MTRDMEAAIADVLARPSDAAYLAFHFRAPVVPPEAFVRAAGSGPWCLLAAPDGPALAGAGAASLLSPVRDPPRASAVLGLGEVEHRTLARVLPARLCAFAAVPFPDDRPATTALARGLAFAPRWTYWSDGARATATFLAPARGCTGSGARQVALEWRGLVSRLGAEFTESAARVATREGASREEYLRLVAAARSAIAGKRLCKVVVSRRIVWRLTEPIDPLILLGRLAAEAGPEARVAVQHEGAAFVAVTPERLARRRETELETEALAGTVDLEAGGPGAGKKELDEHAWVVRAIRRALAPLCAEVQAPATPTLRALRRLAHLHTPIRARLREQTHVLEIARRLHPTPAVGGYPTAEAVRWICAHEDEPRGLYAGLLGWFDEAGDGDLWVGLRGAMTTGREIEQRVGAGIVAASQPEEEWRETEAKGQGFARALGAVP